jgi:hypothetical protein
VCAILGFLGLADYYRCFIKDYGAVVELLTRLLQKTGLCWSTEAEAPFRALQKVLTSAPVLKLPDFDHAFMVECDASGSGIGVVLHQGNGPVTFFSRQIVPRHSKLATYERELIGLVQAI